MADIELVIKISRESYNNLTIGCAQRVSDGEMREAIKNGTPLPKGHGKLKDVDELKKYKHHDYNRCENAVSVAYIDWAETIIEADGEAE